MPHVLSEASRHVELSDAALDVAAVLNFVKSPKAGAVVLFAGTLRSPFRRPGALSSSRHDARHF